MKSLYLMFRGKRTTEIRIVAISLLLSAPVTPGLSVRPWGWCIVTALPEQGEPGTAPIFQHGGAIPLLSYLQPLWLLFSPSTGVDPPWDGP